MDWLGVDLRRLGTALLVFGVVGVLVAGITAAGLLAGAVATRNLDQRVATEQARLVAALDHVDSSMAKTVTTIGNAGATLDTTSQTLASAEAVLAQVGDTADELSGSLNFSILGSQPLAGAATKFGQLAVQVRGFQGKASALADNLGVNATDTRALATEIDKLRAEVADVSARVAAFETTGEIVALMTGGILLLALLTAWLALAGAGCAWMGLRLRELGTRVALEAAAP